MTIARILDMARKSRWCDQQETGGNKGDAAKEILNDARRAEGSGPRGVQALIGSMKPFA
jgi:hypothetical protein